MDYKCVIPGKSEIEQLGLLVAEIRLNQLQTSSLSGEGCNQPILLKYINMPFITVVSLPKNGAAAAGRSVQLIYSMEWSSSPCNMRGTRLPIQKTIPHIPTYRQVNSNKTISEIWNVHTRISIYLHSPCGTLVMDPNIENSISKTSDSS